MHEKVSCGIEEYWLIYGEANKIAESALPILILISSLVKACGPLRLLRVLTPDSQLTEAWLKLSM